MSKAKKTANNSLPGDIFHPGEYIKDELDARSMSQIELAGKMNMSKSEINLLIHGHRNINPNIAVALENVLGIDAEFWMTLQIKYDIDIVKKKALSVIKKSKLSLTKKGKMNQLVTAA